MLFNVLVLAAVLGIAYYHYAQGFFSATISAVIAVIAAILAVSLHEPIVTSLLKGAAADYASGLVMLVVFALTYIILRTIFDKAVPGNIRLPVAVDRVGGAAVGLIAGIFAAGVFTLAAQSFPFGPSIGMYSRYKLGDNREISVMSPSQQRSQDMVVADQMAEDRFDAGSKKGLWIPVDDMLLGAVGYLSDGGSGA